MFYLIINKKHTFYLKRWALGGVSSCTVLFWNFLLQKGVKTPWCLFVSRNERLKLGILRELPPKREALRLPQFDVLRIASAFFFFSVAGWTPSNWHSQVGYIYLLWAVLCPTRFNVWMSFTVQAHWSTESYTTWDRQQYSNNWDSWGSLILSQNLFQKHLPNLVTSNFPKVMHFILSIAEVTTPMPLRPMEDVKVSMESIATRTKMAESPSFWLRFWSTVFSWELKGVPPRPPLPTNG